MRAADAFGPAIARRIFAFALMEKGGMPADQVEPYLHERAWLQDVARLLQRTPESLAQELTCRMVRRGAVIIEDGRMLAAAPHAAVPAEHHAPWPREWRPATSP